MASKERLLLAGLAKPASIGERFDKIPLHVTIFPWVEVERGSYAQFDTELWSVISKYAPLTLEGREKAFFGTNEDIPVRKLARAAFIPLHEEVLETVARFDSKVLGNEWLGDNYVPHVTYVNGEGIEEGETVTVPSLYLIAKTNDGIKVVRSVYELEGQHGQAAA